MDSGKKRLWIGNLDEKITEFQLLKIVQKFGELHQFELIIHRHGPHAGKSRGYAFVSYKNEYDANKAMNSLDGKLITSRVVHVRWAQVQQKEEKEELPKQVNPILQLPVLAGPSRLNAKSNTEIKIRAIEKKLEEMKRKPDLESYLYGSISGTRKLERNRKMNPHRAGDRKKLYDLRNRENDRKKYPQQTIRRR